MKLQNYTHTPAQPLGPASLIEKQDNVNLTELPASQRDTQLDCSSIDGHSWEAHN